MKKKKAFISLAYILASFMFVENNVYANPMYLETVEMEEELSDLDEILSEKLATPSQISKIINDDIIDEEQGAEEENAKEEGLQNNLKEEMVPASLDEEFDEYEYEIRDGDAVLTKYITPASDIQTTVVVPGEIDGYSVIGLEGTFKENQRIEEVIIPEGVQFLGKSTFSHCRALKMVDLPETLTGIDELCFQYSGVEYITLPNALQRIEYRAFQHCENLRYINLQDTLIKIIDEGMFSGCKGLEKISIPDTVEEIDNNAFHQCDSLKTVDFPESVKRIGRAAFNRCQNLEKVSLPISIETIDIGAFAFCDSLEEFVIPENPDFDIYIPGNVVSGIKLKRIINLTDIDYDKKVYNGSGNGRDCSWYLDEKGTQLAEFLPANATIYKIKDSDLEQINKRKGIEEVELDVISGKDFRNANIVVDVKGDHYQLEKIQVNRYNSAEITLLADENYYFALKQASKVKLTGAKYEKATKQDSSTRLIIYISKNVPMEYSSSDDSKTTLEKCADRIKAFLNSGIQMTDANTQEDMTNFIAKKIFEENISGMEFDIEITKENSGVGGFYPAEAGTRNNINGRNGSCGIIINFWLKEDKEDSIETVKEIVTIIAKKYTSSSGGGGGSGSGGGGGGSSSRSVSSGNLNSNSIFITKPNITTGIWEQTEGRWKLKMSDNSYANAQWALLDNKWYLLGSDGYMITGWKIVNGKWYLLSHDGSMLSGWQLVDGKWYYLNLTGEMVIGWNEIGGKWYYMDSSGAMISNNTTPDGYIVNESGEWVQ